jgi:biotin operon repressor
MAKHKPRTQANKGWTNKEVQLLIKLWACDTTSKAVGLRLGRSAAQIRAKISNLRRNGVKELKIKQKFSGHKLTNDQAKAIKSDTRPLRVLAKEFNVSLVTIHRVRAGETWRNA